MADSDIRSVVWLSVIVIRSDVERCDGVDLSSGILLIYKPKRYSHVASSLSIMPSLLLVQHVVVLSVCEIFRIRRFYVCDAGDCGRCDDVQNDGGRVLTTS